MNDEPVLVIESSLSATIRFSAILKIELGKLLKKKSPKISKKFVP